MTTRVRSWVIHCVLLFLQAYSPAYNGTDPMFPRIEIDDAVLADLPARDDGDGAGEVDWASFLNEATAVAPEVYRGVPGANVGAVSEDNDDPGSESGIGRAPEAEVDQGELLRRILEHATTGAPIEMAATWGEHQRIHQCELRRWGFSSFISARSVPVAGGAALATFPWRMVLSSASFQRWPFRSGQAISVLRPRHYRPTPEL